VIRFVVLGKAQTAGSKRAMTYKRKDGSLVTRPDGSPVIGVMDDNPKSTSWKKQVAWAAREEHKGKLLEGPLAVSMYFHRPRPKGHFKKDGSLSKLGVETPFPATLPDVLKLARAVEDALTGVVWCDDAQICVERLEKLWSREMEPAFLTVLIDQARMGTEEVELNKGLVGTIVESLYHEATKKPENLITEGGPYVIERWWTAIEEAYRRGAYDFRAGLHP